jgi:hypothetical protein
MPNLEAINLQFIMEEKFIIIKVIMLMVSIMKSDSQIQKNYFRVTLIQFLPITSLIII